MDIFLSVTRKQRSFLIVNCQVQGQYLLGALEHQYGEEGPLEDKTQRRAELRDGKRERQRRGTSGVRESDSVDDIGCDMSRGNQVKPLIF